MRPAILLVAVLFAAAPATAQVRPVTIDDVLGIRVVAGPAISPDGAAVLFTVRAWHDAPPDGRKDPRTHVWRAPADGNAPARQVTFGEKGDTQPAWSPDGRHMSFVSARGRREGRDAKAQIWVMRTDGGEAWTLTDLTEDVQQHAWSPDSSTIAFTTTDPRAAEESAAVERRDDERIYERTARPVHLWIVDVATKAATRVTSGDEFTITGPLSWSADNAHVAFTAGASALLRDGRRDVYIAQTKTKAVERISTNFGPDTGARFSPDGRAVVYLSEPVTSPAIADGTPRGTVGHSRFMLYDVASRQTRDITGSLAVDPGAPQWTRDGSRLVFTSGARAYVEAFSREVATGRVTQLTKGRTLQLGSFSADGSRVAFTMDTPTAPADVYVADAAFAAPRRVSDANP